MPLIRWICLLSLLGGFMPAQAGQVAKDGRQYYLDLKTRLDIDESAGLEQLFLSLRGNLPRQNNISSLAGGIGSMAKLAGAACGFNALFAQDWNDVDGLYKTLLDRAPSQKESAEAFKNADGQPDYFANCFYLAMSPEFMTRNRGER
jgi:hypothetical protein